MTISEVMQALQKLEENGFGDVLIRGSVHDERSDELREIQALGIVDDSEAIRDLGFVLDITI